MHTSKYTILTSKDPEIVTPVPPDYLALIESVHD